jgi:DNA polymerase-3 subunit epsilon
MIQMVITPEGIKYEESKSTKKQRNKGKSLLNVPSDYILLDLETTGLNPSFDEIIEIACIHMANNKEFDTFHSYVQPTPYKDDDNTYYFVDDFITHLTGITDDMLQDAPKFSSIASQLYAYLSDYVIVGHNVNFDINFLYDNFQKSIDKELKNDFVDTMRLSRIILPDLKHHRLKDLCAFFSITMEQHRAMNDCLITQQVLLQLQSLAIEKEIDLTKYTTKIKYDLTELTGNTSLNDPSHLFYGKSCVFTGKLQRYTRKDAAQIVCNIGGHCENNVTKKTNYLIIGGLDDSPLVKDGKSSKMKKAEKLILEGQDLKILSEDTFYDLLNDSLNM